MHEQTFIYVILQNPTRIALVPHFETFFIPLDSFSKKIAAH